jgi:hypothetical protein
MVGLLPLCASTVISPAMVEKFPGFLSRAKDFLVRNKELLENIHPPHLPGAEGRYLLSVLNETKLRRILTRMLDEEGPPWNQSLSNGTRITRMSSTFMGNDTK